MKKITVFLCLWCALATGFCVRGARPSAVHENCQITSQPGDLVGHVVSKATGVTLVDAHITVQAVQVSVMTDSMGHFRIPHLPTGVYDVVATAPGYHTQKQRVKVRKEDRVEILFELKPNEVTLDGVVVSANRTETMRRQAPTLVSVLGAQTIEATSSVNLAQGLNFQSGLRVENNCQNCGFTQVRINGLDGNYSQILVDSRPVFSALTGVYGLEMIPAAMIDRVEVVRGGGSALFGASAIAGTINIITKEPTYNTGEFKHTTGVYGGSKSFENTTAFNTSLVTFNKKAGLSIFGQSHERQGYDKDGDGFTEKPRISSQAMGLRSFWKINQRTKLALEYHHINDFRRGGDSTHLPPHMSIIAEQAKYNVHGGGLNVSHYSPTGKHRYEAYVSATNSDRESFYGGKTTPKAYGNTHNLTYIIGGQYFFRIPRLIFSPAHLTAGVEYTGDELKDATLDERNPIDQKMRIGSAFLQNEWHSRYLDVLVGARLDKHNLVKNMILSPRVNIKLKPIQDLVLRLGYASGFRAPQTFDEDLHVSKVGGDVAIVTQDPNLKEERSHSLTLSGDYYTRLSEDWQVNFTLEGFYTRLNNVFAMREIKAIEGIKNMQRYNANSANVLGATLEAKLSYANLLTLQAGFTLQSARYKEGIPWSEETGQTERNVLRTPSAYGYYTATITPTRALSISLSGVYTGSMYVPHYAGYIAQDIMTHSPSFFDMGVKVAYEFRMLNAVDLQLNAGVKNIFNAYQNDFDRGGDRDSQFIYGPVDPQQFYAGLKFSF